MDREFDSGEIVEHKLSKEWLMVLKVTKEDNQVGYLCRLKNLESRFFADFELQEREQRK